MNEQSLRETNAILAAAASRTRPGGIIETSPAQLAEDAGVEGRLAVARAMRALLSRGRVEQEGDRYRLVDARPLGAGEPASVRRPARRAPSKRRAEGPPTYDDVGRAVIERLMEVSAEASELRASLERARTEAEAARREAVEVARAAHDDRRRADSREDEVAALKRRLEMTEENLRKVVEAAKNRPSQPIDDTDAKAILDILRTGSGNGSE